MKKLEEYLKPKTMEEAVNILAEAKNDTRIIAGGTSEFIRNSRSIRKLVDIKGLGLNYIKAEKKEIHIGATTTINELLESEIIKKYCSGIIYKAAYNLASTPLRNLITTGGNLLQVSGWSDLPLAFLLAGAGICIQGKQKAEIMPYKELFGNKIPSNEIQNRLVTEIILPYDNGCKGSFIKFSKTSFDFAILDAAVMVKLKDKKFEVIKMGISASSNVPVMLNTASSELTGKKISDEKAIDMALETAVAEVKFASDFRVVDGYKKEIMPVLLKRLIKELI